MKSKISSFNFAPIKKNITRFAPLWVLYLIGGTLVMLLISSGQEPGYLARDLDDTLFVFPAFNLAYAFLTAMLLFGDLHNARMCNALHAMPMRREVWYLSHVISGLLFSIVPHIFAMLMIGIFLRSFWYVGLLWIAAMALQYLFFFSIAVFSAVCTGNRQGMVLVYAMLNFLSVIVYWFADTIYSPLLYGMSVSYEPFERFCPVWHLSALQGSGDNMQYILLERVKQSTSWGDSLVWKFTGLGGAWGYALVLALIGVVMLGVSLLLYRRRALESAGDFLCFRPMEPIFLVLYTLCAGALFAVIGEVFTSTYLTMLIVGVCIGFFTGMMLLRRSAKVFSAKSFAALGIFSLLLLFSVLLVYIDPIGITRWVPEAKDVESVKVSVSYVSSGILTDEESIQTVIDMHQEAIENRNVEYSGNTANVTIDYTLSSGFTVERYYSVPTTALDFLTKPLSTPEAVLGVSSKEELLAGLEGAYIETYWLGGEVDGDCYYNWNDFTMEASADFLTGLVDALWADCEAGTLAQVWAFHNNSAGYISLTYTNSAGEYRYENLTVYEDSTNTVAYLQENFIDYLAASEDSEQIYE